MNHVDRTMSLVWTFTQIVKEHMMQRTMSLVLTFTQTGFFARISTTYVGKNKMVNFDFFC